MKKVLMAILAFWGIVPVLGLVYFLGCSEETRQAMKRGVEFMQELNMQVLQGRRGGAFSSIFWALVCFWLTKTALTFAARIVWRRIRQAFAKPLATRSDSRV